MPYMNLFEKIYSYHLHTETFAGMELLWHLFPIRKKLVKAMLSSKSSHDF